MKDTCTEISTNIIGTSAEKTKPLNADIFTTDSQMCEDIFVALIEENSNCADHASNLIKLNQISYSPQFQDSSEIETTQNSPTEMITDIGLWPENMSKYVDYWINKGIIHLQNCDEELIKEKSFVRNK